MNEFEMNICLTCKCNLFFSDSYLHLKFPKVKSIREYEKEAYKQCFFVFVSEQNFLITNVSTIYGTVPPAIYKMLYEFFKWKMRCYRT